MLAKNLKIYFKWKNIQLQLSKSEKNKKNEKKWETNTQGKREKLEQKGPIPGVLRTLSLVHENPSLTFKIKKNKKKRRKRKRQKRKTKRKKKEKKRKRERFFFEKKNIRKKRISKKSEKAITPTFVCTQALKRVRTPRALVVVVRNAVVT